VTLAGEWFLVELVLSGATKRVESSYSGRSINWAIVNETVLLAGLAAGCSLLERSGLKGANEHITVLFDIRNALVHNGGDLSRNIKKSALAEADDYLTNRKHLSLSKELNGPFFSLSGSMVRLEPNVLFALRQCMI
jgi:hypothetical protein